MHFQHAAEIWHDFPYLVPGVVYAEGVRPDVALGGRVQRYLDMASARLAERPESEFPEIQAWRRVFATMGLKPTQYRCAAESLLRRFRKDGTLPQLHPLVQVCNAISIAYAIPVAVFDVAKIAGQIDVRYATGDEEYLTFSGDVEHPTAHEVVFADSGNRAHARRWTNRQSGLSAVQDSTTAALIIAEAVHASAAPQMSEVVAAIAAELDAVWAARPARAVLSQSSPRFAFQTP